MFADALRSLVAFALQWLWLGVVHLWWVFLIVVAVIVGISALRPKKPPRHWEDPFDGYIGPLY